MSSTPQGETNCCESGRFRRRVSGALRMGLMTPNPIRFGTDGWRAVVADDFTYANVRAVAQGVASFLGAEQRPVVVGHDSRYCAELFAREVARILVANGQRVVLLDR